MDRIECMKMQLIAAIESEMQDLKSADCEELYKAIDMLKDLEEAQYYCTITESMKANKKEEEQIMYYTEPHSYLPTDDMYMERLKDMSGRRGRRYNNGNGDYAGRSGESRRMYMESKDLNHEKSVKMQELETYMKDLTKDLVEMIEDSSPEEKQLLQQKLTILTNKIAQVNV